MFRDWFILLVFRTFLARRLKRSSPSVLLNLLYCRLSSILIFSSGSFLTVARSTVLLLLLTILWEELVMWTLRIQFLWWKILFFWRSPRLMERLVLRLWFVGLFREALFAFLSPRILVVSRPIRRSSTLSWLRRKWRRSVRWTRDIVIALDTSSFLLLRPGRMCGMERTLTKWFVGTNKSFTMNREIWELIFLNVSFIGKHRLIDSGSWWTRFLQPNFHLINSITWSLHSRMEYESTDKHASYCALCSIHAPSNEIKICCLELRIFSKIYAYLWLVQSKLTLNLSKNLKLNTNDLLHCLHLSVLRKGQSWMEKRKVPPRFELGLQDSESWVLTITPWDQQ